MRISEISFTAYPVTDLARARRFYEEVLGLKVGCVFGKSVGWVEYEIGAGTLAISNYKPEWKTATPGCMVGLEVGDLDAAAEEVKASGMGTVEGFEESAVCHMAMIKDPDGNVIVLHKRKEG